jgi:hypothetical protein
LRGFRQIRDLADRYFKCPDHIGSIATTANSAPGPLSCRQELTEMVRSRGNDRLIRH